MKHPNWVEDLKKKYPYQKNKKLHKLFKFADAAFQLAAEYTEASGGLDETPTEFLNRWSDK